MADIQPSQDDPASESLIPVPTATGVVDDPSTAPKVTPSPSKAKATAESEATSAPIVAPVEEPTLATETTQPVPAQVTLSDTPPAPGDFDDVKQKALTDLKPLLDTVDLPADQKFHTILEIISATNDKSLIPKLYEAASGIEDPTEKAKALVDVVSEIEYLNSEAA